MLVNSRELYLRPILDCDESVRVNDLFVNWSGSGAGAVDGLEIVHPPLSSAEMSEEPPRYDELATAPPIANELLPATLSAAFASLVPDSVPE